MVASPNLTRSAVYWLVAETILIRPLYFWSHMYLYTRWDDFNFGELFDIDVGYCRKLDSLQQEYDGLLTRVRDFDKKSIPPVIFASTTEKQLSAIELLHANGFKQIGVGRINPNSGNKIIAFMKSSEPVKADHIEQEHAAFSTYYKASILSYNNGKPLPFLAGSRVSCGLYFMVNANLIASQDDLTKAYAGNPNDIGVAANYKAFCAIVIAKVLCDNANAIKALKADGYFEFHEDTNYYPAQEPVSYYMRYITKQDRIKYGCTTRYDAENKTNEEEVTP